MESKATVSKFKDLTQCVSWRSDGKLFLAGEASGSCAVIEADTRNVLRRFRNHGDAVTCCSFAGSDKSRAATGARDGRLRIWDVTTSDMILETAAHSDRTTVLCPGPGGPDSWISCGHDGRVKVWDLRIGARGADAEEVSASRRCVASFDHGEQVDSGCAFPGAQMYVSAGGKSVKVWDITAGKAAPVIVLPDAHTKAVTAVCLDDTASSLLTVSFDGLAKVFHAATLSHVWTYRMPGPLTCAAWRPGGGAFAVGMDDGQWQIRERKTDAESTPAKKEDKSYRKREGRMRGADAKPAEDDEVMDTHRPAKKRISQVDWFLKKFEYKKAVHYMLGQDVPVKEGLAVIDEMLQRGCLGPSLSDVGEDTCLAVLRWVHKASGSGDSLQENLVFETLHTLLDSNECMLPPSSQKLREALERLEHKVSQELRVQEALFETSGMLETVMNL